MGNIEALEPERVCVSVAQYNSGSQAFDVLTFCSSPCLQTVGMLTIVSDNAFEVTNWTYTGMAPSVHWVTAASTSPADLE